MSGSEEEVIFVAELKRCVQSPWQSRELGNLYAITWMTNGVLQFQHFNWMPMEKPLPFAIRFY